ncbi:TonB-dependent siderophore receptor [Pantoea sp. 18069]|uniref:TonB-dependent receptor family protein n=1 Tax=Pantoea sp. 18069 TaxID=2681415 RepID=UPI00135BB06E|nr:TonB-dependent siderophore receptor [Pantoea sp. 18069]
MVLSHRPVQGPATTVSALTQCAAAAAAVAAALFALPSLAQTASDPHAAEPAATGLSAVTVTGNWLSGAASNAEKVLEHAGARTIVDRQRIQESGSASLREALRLVPGVQVQDSNGTGGSDVSLNLGVRGLTARLSPRSYVLQDGVPVSYAPYGQPQLSLAPVALGNLESVDVVRGAGSVRYGPQNVGGIINFVTRAIPKDFAGEVSVGTEIYGQGGNVKTTPSFFVGGTNEAGLGLAVLYSGTHGKGWRGSNDKTDIDDVLVKSSYRLSPNSGLSASLHHFEGKGLMPGGLTSAQYAADPFQSTRSYDQFTGRRTDGSLKYSYEDGRNSFEVLGYYVDSFRGSYLERDGTGANAGRRSLNGAPRSYSYYGIEPRYSRIFETGPVVQEVSVGYRHLKEKSSETAQVTAFYAPGQVDAMALPLGTTQTSQGGTTANAFYIDNRIDWGNWTITPGVRYERIRSFNNVVDYRGPTGVASSPKAEANEWLPTLSALYRMNDNWSVFANAGKSFGPQQYAQLAQSSGNQLHPESAKTYELGTHFKSDSWSGELTLFNIDFDKELFLDRPDGSGTGVWTDLGATRHRGLESALRYDLGKSHPAFKGLSLGMTYTFTQAVNQAGDFAGRDLPLYSRHTAALSARYAIERWTFNAELNAQSRQRSPGTPGTTIAPKPYVTQEDANGNLGDIPGFSTLGLRASYQGGKDLHNLRLTVGMKNVLDRRYFTRSTDSNGGGKYVGMPRTLYVQGTIAF